MLLRQLSEGREHAFNELFLRHRSKLYAFLLKLTHSPQIAEEIVIDIFVKIWLGRELMSPMDHFESFLMTVARNKGIDFLRTTARHARLQEVYSQNMTAVADKTADERLIDAEEIALWTSAVNQLPPQRRTIYKLRTEQGMTYDQIASALNLSRNTVRNQLSAATQSIAGFLKKQHPGKAALVFLLYAS